MPRTFVTRVGEKGVAVFRSVRDLTAREKRFLLNEVLQVRGLMPLLMKQRNRGRWSPDDRAELRMHLRRLSGLSPYLVVLAMPGSVILLPMLAWWLDRRRNRTRRAPRIQARN
jgi:hypothetical protein